MIIKLDKLDLNLINKIESTFNDLDEKKINVLNDFKYNPYTNYLVYLMNNNPIAYINYNNIIDRFEIVDFYVLNEYRNNGIGAKLLKNVIEIAEYEGAINITLEVRKDNLTAINLYKNNGFIEKAIRKKYYSSIDGILMEKEMI